ncbi:MAG: dihydropteroate synthase [Flavobacteriia bacterium]|nr:dihydropteroate synthase [Flavobacteriia bacterium]
MKKTIRVGSGLIDLSSPKIMGIINLTPDSFYDGGSSTNVDDALRKAEQMLEEGADWLDIGAQSTRPKAEQIGAEKEWSRLEGPLQAISARFPNAVLSIDTYHSSIAEKSILSGGHIINDISGGTLDSKMFETMGKLKVPYILMHIQGTPESMQENPTYNNVVVDVTRDLASKCAELIAHGVDDILIDPGFGFGKTNEHNFALLKNLEHLKSIGHPILVGLSRKSMIWKTLGSSAQEALNGTTALNMTALMNGASVLRVHDVKAAAEVRTLWLQLQNSDRIS